MFAVSSQGLWTDTSVEIMHIPVVKDPFERKTDTLSQSTKQLWDRRVELPDTVPRSRAHKRLLENLSMRQTHLKTRAHLLCCYGILIRHTREHATMLASVDWLKASYAPGVEKKRLQSNEPATSTGEDQPDRQSTQIMNGEANEESLGPRCRIFLLADIRKTALRIELMAPIEGVVWTIKIIGNAFVPGPWDTYCRCWRLLSDPPVTLAPAPLKWSTIGVITTAGQISNALPSKARPFATPLKHTRGATLRTTYKMQFMPPVLMPRLEK
ncbi:hypothetical protein PENSPDRAFT_669692 [Peniophora sp. CONT]|nr:hypothetical protein PENSPDRAFT_669692 [Peniophora sp. CONT]